MVATPTKPPTAAQPHQDPESWRDSIPGIHFAAHAEGVALFDHQSRRHLGISGDEFLERWDRGEYTRAGDLAEARKIRRVARLIRFARRD